MTTRQRLIKTTTGHIIDSLNMGAIRYGHVNDYVLREYIKLTAADDETLERYWKSLSESKRYRVMTAVLRAVQMTPRSQLR